MTTFETTLSHTHIVFLLYVSLSFSLLLLSQKKRGKMP